MAALAAAALARRMAEPLHLVHVLDLGSAVSVASLIDSMRREVSARLEQQAGESASAASR